MTRQQNVRLREEALEYGRVAMDESWREPIEPSTFTGRARRARKINRALRAASRAGSTLFRLMCGEPDDVSLCVAYGEVACARSSIFWWGSTRQSLGVSAAVEAARASLWAFDRVDPTAGNFLGVAQAIRAEESAPETAFLWAGDGIGKLLAEHRIASAADARFWLADALATFRPRHDNNEFMTSGMLDATIRARDKYYRYDEMLTWRFRTEVCLDLDTSEEAQMLAVGAAETYRALVAAGTGFGPDDTAQADARKRDIFRKLFSSV